MMWLHVFSLLVLLQSARATPTSDTWRHPVARRAVPTYGRSDRSTARVAPSPEAAVWQTPPSTVGLGGLNVTTPGLSPEFPEILCNKKELVCQVVTGEGEINAASTISALVLSPYFDLTKTYFMVAGIAGISPQCGTIGGVSIAQYAVQVGLEYEIDIRELTKNYTAGAGYFPLGATAPYQYPAYIYGTEVFELSQHLQNRAYNLASKATLNDSSTAKAYRARYPNAPANKPPSVFKGDVATSDVYYHGALLSNAFDKYITLLTNGTGRYCMTAQEDNAVMEALLRADLAGLIDFTRIISMRTAANFDRPPPGEEATTQLFYDNSGGFELSLANIYNAGILILRDVVNNWATEYENGLSITNYYGDILHSITGQAFPPNFGPPVAAGG